ncbi:MAG: ABC transporter permease [Chloroflexaceae bacterium]|nr:ABC transporter permease [Chloroflexaceae bacterium]NJO06414.1 ABC transporter permease [Chloroflexaceae bacterium]
MAQETLTRPRTLAPAQHRTAPRSKWGELALRANALFSYFFLYAPIAILVIFSFSNSNFAGAWGGFTFEWYIRLFQNDRLMEALGNSLYVAFISMLIATVIGTMVALAMERFRFRGRTVFDAVLYLPIVIPDIVMAVMLLLFFSTGLQLINNAFDMRIRPGLTTIIIAHVAFNISFVAVVVRASLRNFDWVLEEAAQDLGANEIQTFTRITLPIILPGILGGALLAFTLSLDDYIIAFFTTGPGASTLPIEVFSKIRRSVTPEINAISTVMLIASVGLVVMSQFFQRRRG